MPSAMVSFDSEPLGGSVLELSAGDLERERARSGRRSSSVGDVDVDVDAMFRQLVLFIFCQAFLLCQVTGLDSYLESRPKIKTLVAAACGARRQLSAGGIIPSMNVAVITVRRTRRGVGG